LKNSAEEMQLQIDDLTEHPLLTRMQELSIVQYNFTSWSECENYEDVTYTLKISACTSNLIGRLHSLNRLLRATKADQSIEEIQFGLHALINALNDSAVMRTTSIADILLLLTNDVLELGLDDKLCTFGEISKRVSDKTILEPLGKLTNPKQQRKLTRNMNFHAGIEPSLDEQDQAFEIGSRFREIGMNYTLNHPSSSSPLELQELFNNRLEDCMKNLISDCERMIPLAHSIITKLESQFTQRIHEKMHASGSFWLKERSEGKK
jgi:hypothetical protein